jgi:DNA polymerase-3 subunit alpha
VIRAAAQEVSSLKPQASGLLRFGLAAIKGVGEKAVSIIVRAREEGGPFANLFDFCERVDLTVVNRGVIEALVKAGAFDSTGAMRKALVLALDKALQAGSTVQRDRESGQMSMFGSFDVAQSPSTGATHSGGSLCQTLSTEEWTEAEMLAHEKSVLGFYVTSHPLTRQSEELRKFASADCADFAGLEDGALVTIGGMISRVRTMMTKAGRNAGSKLAVLIIEDLTGNIEAVVYSDELETYRALIGPDRLVFLRGRVDRRREDPSLKVSEVIAFEDGAAKLAEAVIVNLSAVGAEAAILEKLRDICRAHPGDRNLFLRVRSPGELVTLVRCDAALGVSPGAGFVAELERLLGRNCVEIVGRRRGAPNPVKTSVPTDDELLEAAVV